MTDEIEGAKQNIVPCEVTTRKEETANVDELPVETSDMCECVERYCDNHITKKKQRKQHKQKYVVLVVSWLLIFLARNTN